MASQVFVQQAYQLTVNFPVVIFDELFNESSVLIQNFVTHVRNVVQNCLVLNLKKSWVSNEVISTCQKKLTLISVTIVYQIQLPGKRPLMENKGALFLRKLVRS